MELKLKSLSNKDGLLFARDRVPSLQGEVCSAAQVGTEAQELGVHSVSTVIFSPTFIYMTFFGIRCMKPKMLIFIRTFAHILPSLFQVVPREGEPSGSKTLLAPSTRRDICAPFPELKHLSLAFNKVIWALWLRISVKIQLLEPGLSSLGDTLGL